jgi:protein-S-isoprenylcysteine O-methyltransferase Ste14
VIGVLRHLIAIVVLPGTVTVLVPIWIARRYDLALTPPVGVRDIALMAAGLVAIGIGLLLFIASLRRFATEGRGTLAPWDPPRHLVVRGPYRYVRNPMISGVTFIVFGEALVLRSWPHAVWAVIFFALNVMWIPLYEEPHLERIFGDEYREYRKHVRRFLPRLSPWSGPAYRRPT